MHIADYCVTDAKSARAVARALGRPYVIWHAANDIDRDINESNSNRVKIGYYSYYVEKESGLVVLCPDECCRNEREAYLGRLKCT